MHAGLTALARIREALDAAGDGLAAARLDVLESCEPALAAAVAQLSQLQSIHETDADRDAVRDAVRRTRASLARCRRLGAALDEFTRATMVAQGRAGAYARDGRERLDRRAGVWEARG